MSRSRSATPRKKARNWSRRSGGRIELSKLACSAAATISISRLATRVAPATWAGCGWSGPTGSTRVPSRAGARSRGPLPGPPRDPFRGPIDWPAWVGPAPSVPEDPLVFFNWRSLAAYSGGIAQDQGCHIFDSIHLIMDAGYPVSVNATALKPHVEGMDQPESVVVAAEYPDGFMAVFTINYNAMRYASRADQLNAYDGSQARMDIGREFLRIYPSTSPETAAFAKEQPGGFAQATIDHVMNFLHCVRTRETPRATMDKGFQAALIVQLANISIREGRKVGWDSETLSVV